MTFDADGRERDTLGRIQPSKFNWIKFARAVPGLIGDGFDRLVPGSFYTRDLDDEGDECFVVACPCDETVTIKLTKVKECSCGRFYMATGETVAVACSPAPLPQAPTPVVD